jgi:hypothetical protein
LKASPEGEFLRLGDVGQVKLGTLMQLKKKQGLNEIDR